MLPQTVRAPTVTFSMLLIAISDINGVRRERHFFRTQIGKLPFLIHKLVHIVVPHLNCQDTYSSGPINKQQKRWTQTCRTPESLYPVYLGPPLTIRRHRPAVNCRNLSSFPAPSQATETLTVAMHTSKGVHRLPNVTRLSPSSMSEVNNRLVDEQRVIHDYDTPFRQTLQSL